MQVWSYGVKNIISAEVFRKYYGQESSEVVMFEYLIIDHDGYVYCVNSLNGVDFSYVANIVEVELDNEMSLNIKLINREGDEIEGLRGSYV
jgi:hypothetical protein